MSLYNAEQLTKAVLESLGILVGGRRKVIKFRSA